ncbi:MAG: phosphatase PAP2 family protein [Bacteroidales bacterium]|nr:phosphatase PAP2 family protein [Bacteroidales bacterium]
MDWLIEIDRHFTLWLNTWHTGFADCFYYLLTATTTWIPFYLVLAWMIFKQQGGRGLVTIIAIGLLVLVADQVSSSILKPLIERPRPSHDEIMQWMVHLVNDRRGGMFGFVSSHAANTFAVATFLTLIVRHAGLSLTLYIWAILNSYSRVYNGMHFVGDIVCGALIGIILASVAYQFYLRSVYHFFVIPHHNKRTLKSGLGRMFGESAPMVVAASIWFTILLLIIIAILMLKWNGVVD